MQFTYMLNTVYIIKLPFMNIDYHISVNNCQLNGYYVVRLYQILYTSNLRFNVKQMKENSVNKLQCRCRKQIMYHAIYPT